MPARYSELHPSELAELTESGATAVLPWGALEWHGDHLPLGLDGIVAEWFASRLADSIGGVLLPGIWLPVTTLPHRFSLQVDTETLRRIGGDTIEGLARAGFASLAIVTGHYAQGHLWELYELARHAPIPTYVGTPLEPLGDDDLLDHAAAIETSQLLAVQPELVRLGSLPAVLRSTSSAVLGKDPRHGSAELGAQLLESGLAAWQNWLAASPLELDAHYSERMQTLAPYRDAFYRTSWEQAILDWWKSKTG